MKLTGAKTLMAEQRTTIDEQSGEKMPTEDQKNTLAEPMALNTTGAEQLGLNEDPFSRAENHHGGSSGAGDHHGGAGGSIRAGDHHGGTEDLKGGAEDH